MGICSAAKGSEGRNLISVTFSVDGKTVGCNERKLRLRLHGELIEPEALSGGFFVPDNLHKKTSRWPFGGTVCVGVTHAEYSDHFLSHPAFVRFLEWGVGVVDPPHRVN